MKLFSKLFALVLSLGILAGCGPTSTPTDPTNPSVDPSVEPSVNPTPDWIDYVHDDERARLALDYKNESGESRDFFVDGIGQVELRNTIDGDTAHFNSIGHDGTEYIKTRFYGIDTPESTGQIQLWGKSASKFTSEKLKNKSIISSV